MNILIFGATGMVGRGVLLECLRSRSVSSVTVIGRSALDIEHAKLRAIIHSNMWDYTGIEDQLKRFSACYFCLGVSSNGLSEERYAHITYDLTMAAANTLAKFNPNLVFVYVSGSGTDTTEQGSSMWARVKGKTENALLDLPIKQAYMFRPGVIQPLDGIRSKTKAYQLFYTFTKPILSILRMLLPNYVATTRTVAQAMLQVSLEPYSEHIIYTRDIEILSRKFNELP